MNINFRYGITVSFNEMPANSIALDGACQAPQIDPASRRYSFDHHAGCLRFATLATCQQVALAIRMGLVTDDETKVYCNDWDADTVLAIWLLQNPGKVNEPKVVELVEKVGLMDAHFIGPAHPVHHMLTPRWGTVQTPEQIEGFLAILDSWYQDTLVYPTPRKQTGKAFGWSQATGWEDMGEINDGFLAIYKAGFTAGVAYCPAQNGTTLYTVGRRSDFVQVPTGPSHIDRDEDPSSYRPESLLGSLALAEIAANPQQSHKTNWGGASTVGGGPRNEGNVGSVLTPEQVFEICRKFGG